MRPWTGWSQSGKYQYQLRQNQNHRHFEQQQAMITRDIEHQFKCFLNAAQLRLHRCVTIGQVELGPKIIIDAVHHQVASGLSNRWSTDGTKPAQAGGPPVLMGAQSK
jgi:hypothetical protein